MNSIVFELWIKTNVIDPRSFLLDLSRYYLSGAKNCEGHVHSVVTSLLFDSKVVDVELR